MSLQVGEKAPHLNTSFVDTEGTEHILSDRLQDGPVLLALYKSSCGASKAMMPVLNRFVQHYGESGLQVIGVAQDSLNVTRSFARRSGGLDYPILIEGDDFPLSDSFDIFATPTIYVIRTDGSIAYTTMGFLRVQMEEISREVASVLGTDYQPIIHEEIDEEVPLFVPG